jgi:hypothetical protein
MAPNHYLYPLNPKSKQGYRFEDDHGNTFPTSLAGFLDCYSNEATAEWGVYHCADDLNEGDFIWVHFSLPISAICAVGKIVGKPKDNPSSGAPKKITIKWDWNYTKRLQSHPIPYSSFKQRVPVSVRRANTKTQTVLNNWIKGKYPPIKKSRTTNVRFKTAEVQVRQGQPEFRVALLAAYDHTCVISGCVTRDALQAAHIKSVADGGLHSTRNGLILRADLHNLFDRGLITIDEKGFVHVDPVVKDREYRAFHGLKLPMVLRNADMRLLKSHRKKHKGD